MEKQLQKLDIDSHYASALRESKTDIISLEGKERSIPVVTELYERAKINYQNKVVDTKKTTENLMDRRSEYFTELKDKLRIDIEKEYIELDKEVAVSSEKAKIEKENKLRLIENKLAIINDFRESEKEMLEIIDQSIQFERERQASGESSWDNISAFIEDIKSKTLPAFKKRKEEEIDPLLEDVTAFKNEVKRIEKELLNATEQINIVHSKKLLLLNKNHKQEELRIMDLHRRTLAYLEIQMQTARDNLKRLSSILEELTFEKNKKTEEIKKQVLLDRKELMLQFSSNLDSEFEDLDSTMASFDNIGKIQSDMKSLTSFVREELVESTNRIEKSDQKLLDTVMTSNEEGK